MGLGFHCYEVEEQGGGFPAEVEVTLGLATSGGSDGAWAFAGAVLGCLGKRKRLLC